LLRVNGESGGDFTLWKANLNAVDLNTNFAARWGTGKSNVRFPSPSGYIGAAPESEPETRALVSFTKAVKPALTISYHARGEEIYWEFTPAARAGRDRAIGEKLAKVAGYKLVDGDLGSAGGYKDWCIQELGVPAYTIEIIKEKYAFPLDGALLDGAFERNKNIPLIALNLCKGA